MKTYYREYRDGDRRKPTGVMCVFSDGPLPVEAAGLSQEELWQNFKCLTAERTSTSGEPLLNECSLVYLLSTTAVCTEEEAATIGPEMVDLIKRSEQHANSKNG